ncbi:ATP-dependent peptidase [Aureococcus anophagefferens]|uniref:ATP-dependent peptidase n=1 Tax=Aureococcus anophagefferens TaxID=44056 RepID=A0ABR1FG71_AURAN
MMALSALRGVAARGAGPALRRPAPAMNLAIGSRSRRPLVTLTQKHALALPRSAIDERRRGIWSFLRNRQLKKLERAANDAPEDGAAQMTFVRALAAEHPEAALRRIEALSPAQHEALLEPLTREYLKALVATGQMDTAPLADVKARLAALGGGGDGGQGGRPPRPLAAAAAPPAAAAGAFAGASTSFVPPVGAAAALGAAGTPNPVQVAVVQAGWRQQLWRTLRVLAVAFIALSAFGALMDDRGMSSRLGAASTAVHTAENSDKRFSDVMGVDEAKQELEEIVMFLSDPTRFTRLGGKLPKGCLLMGPPGTGKTLLARAIAGEAGVPFFYASGSEFEEMYVGVGARRVRDLFEAAKKRSPCIIFIDEIDAIGASRHLKEQQAMKMTLNQLLVEMDGFEQNHGVIVIGATNIADSLDPALLRPGRFDRHVSVPLPDVEGRKQILKLHSGKIPLDADADIDALARGTPGMSGADLSNLVNQAALKAALDGLDAVTTKALDYAKDKILMGAERRSAVLTKETMKMTAYHEGGHALVAMLTSGADPVHKATIMPRGQALGMVQQLPEGDQTSISRKQMLARMDVCMGGRVAEELIYGADGVSSGASSDIYQATRLARNMVTKWGFSDEVGVVYHSGKWNADDAPAPETRAAIDREVQKLLTDSYGRATKLLVDNRALLDAVATTLIDRETLTGKDLQDLVASQTSEPEPPVAVEPPKTTISVAAGAPVPAKPAAAVA